MRIGVPREIKTQEYRVGLTPESVAALTADGHQVFVEHGAGIGIAAGDDDYRAAGATALATAAEVFDAADLIVKVKEPLAPERARLKPGQSLFTYLHLAPDLAQTRELVASGAIAIAYETVTSPEGRLPLLAPMSEVAGRMAVQVAARFLERPQGGRGVLLAGATGVPPARVLVLGAGVVSGNAAQIALALGSEVVVLDSSAEALRRLEGKVRSPKLVTAIADEARLAQELPLADAVIAGVLKLGARAPKLITRPMLSTMKPGSVIVDVSIDQGGCAETSRPTTHDDPTYVVDGVVHYCVANMPGAVPRTSTYALNHATLPYVRALAGRGIRRALEADPALMAGLNVAHGRVTRREVADAHGLPYTEPRDALALMP